MEFKDYLNEYINRINCTQKELAQLSNISTSVITRYKNGERIPNFDSIQIKSLINAFDILIKKNNIKDLNTEEIENNFKKVLYKEKIDIDIFIDNFNLLIDNLNINVRELSNYIGYDPSYLSKIRTKKRKPQNTNDFINGIIKYIKNNYNTNDDLEKLSKIINKNINNIDNDIRQWILNNRINKRIDVKDFLFKLDEFDLNEYIKIIRFDKLIVPTLPIDLPKNKIYYGLNGYKNSQLDILKYIILSKSTNDIYFYSNMSMIEASKDKEFTKKFMGSLALILKKGLTLNMIHDLDRPFDELILGLIGWIPLYMTGQIKPYYFNNNSNLIYSNMEITNNNISLSGSYITGNINNSRFYITTKKEEVNFYKKNFNNLLTKANSLMDIYKENKKIEFNNLLNNNINIKGERKNIYYNLPIYTISDNLLNRILDYNKINNQDKLTIINYVKKEKERINIILNDNTILDEINIINKDDSNNISLSLSNMFFNKKIYYKYEDYLEHINLIKKYNKKNYSYIINNDIVFKNINISIIKDKQVIISKENNPTIHFVIHHKKLISAIYNFKVNKKY